MKKSKSKVIRIGGKALEILKELKKNTCRTMKGTAEMLIEQGMIRLKMLSKYSDDFDMVKNKSENKENCYEN